MEQEKEEKKGKTKREERIKVPKNPFLGIDLTKFCEGKLNLKMEIIKYHFIYLYVYEHWLVGVVYQVYLSVGGVVVVAHHSVHLCLGHLHKVYLGQEGE